MDAGELFFSYFLAALWQVGKGHDLERDGSPAGGPAAMITTQMQNAGNAPKTPQDKKQKILVTIFMNCSHKALQMH